MLRISDIDSNCKLIRVEQGKGRKDRYAMLSPQLLELLRAWWVQCRSQGWLFPGRDPLLPVTTRQLNRACTWQQKQRVLARGSPHIPCGTRLPHTCWRPTRMFVLAYLSRYTHRVAISNARLITADADNVTFKVKDYRVEGPARYTTMTLRPAEFIRRFLVHVLPKGFHRIRHYGLLAAATKAETIATVRDLLSVTSSEPDHEGETAHDEPTIVGDCPCCGGRMHIIETFEPGCRPRHPPSADQDRYLMSPRTVSRIRSTVIQPCWSIARCGAAHAPIAIPLSRQPISLLPALRHVSAQPSPALAHSQDAVRLTKTAQRYPNKKRKIPIAVAARTLAYLSRVLSLEAFGHRPRAWLNRCHWPVSETLHTNGTTTS